jgi:hypothetical protein
MFIKHARRELLMLGILGISISQVAIASAQMFGTNAPPCPSHCAPSPWWGYVQTRWTRWPGATYPDMIKAPGTTNGEEISAPGVELPKPGKETEIRSVLPSGNNNKSSSAAPATEPAQSTTEPMTTTPTPEFQPSPETTPNANPTLDNKPSDMPPLKQAPGAMPPSDNPFFAPPSTPEPPAPAPSNGSSTTPKTRLHAPIAKTFSGASQIHVVSEQPTVPDTTTTAQDPAIIKPLRLRLDAEDFSRPVSSPDQEPELIVPSLASRPLPKMNVDVSAQQPTVAQAQAANPLRGNFGARAVVPANLNSLDMTRSDASSAGNASAQYGTGDNPVIGGGVGN